MCRCDWCNYELSKVHPENPGFDGYTCFDEYGYSLRYYFCSINCAIAYVNFDNSKSDAVIDKRIDWIYKIYDIRDFVCEAKKINRLTINGGNLTYDEYRNGFCCPKVKEYYGSYRINYSNYQSDEYNEYDYDNDYLQDEYDNPSDEKVNEEALHEDDE